MNNPIQNEILGRAVNFSENYAEAFNYAKQQFNKYNLTRTNIQIIAQLNAAYKAHKIAIVK